MTTVFHRFDQDKSGDIDARELREALQALGLATDTAQAAKVLAKYDRDHSGKLEFDEFLHLVTELRGFQRRAQGGAPVTHVDSSRLAGASVLSFALRNALFVGETYTLEVLESAELEAATLDFFVEFVDRQSVEVRIARKCRPLTAVLKYVQDDVESFPLDVRSEAVTVVARHKGLGKVTSSALARQGVAELPAENALYVGMTYLLEIEGGDGLSSKACEVTIGPGKAPLVADLPVGPASGKVHVSIRDALASSGYPLEHLGLPPISFAIHPVPRANGREKLVGTTDAKGKATLAAGAQLYVGRSYTLEVGREANQYVVEPASVEFKVVKGEQSVRLDVQRAVGDVRAVFQTTHANSTHWAAPLKLPAPFEFRVLHRKLNAVAFASEVPRQPSHTMRQALPGKHTLFVGEQYTIELGYQIKEVLKRVTDAISELLADGKLITFNGAGEGGLPSIAQAWSVDFHGDRKLAEQNHATLDAVAALMRAYPMVCIDVRSETGGADWASKPLADYYKLDRTRDVQLLNDHLARNRAQACVEALVARKIERSRLSASFRGRTGRLITTFRARPPRHSKLGDPRSGLEYTRAHFTVQPPQLLSGPQDVTLTLQKATGDVKLLFQSQHADPNHWSHFLSVPPGLKLDVRHTALDRLVTSGIVTSDDRSCYLPGGEVGKELYAMEHYTLALEGGTTLSRTPTRCCCRPATRRW